MLDVEEDETDSLGKRGYCGLGERSWLKNPKERQRKLRRMGCPGNKIHAQNEQNHSNLNHDSLSYDLCNQQSLYILGRGRFLIFL